MKKYKKYAAVAVFMVGIGLSGTNFRVQADEQTAVEGRLVEDGGKTYYLYPDGTFARDWVAMGDDWYFFWPSDGTMAADTVINGFMFGPDGKFIGMEPDGEPETEPVTEPGVKNQQLKDRVDEILSAIIMEDMSEEEKIRTCYLYIINKTTYKRTYDTPSGDWTGDYALQLLTSGEGNCYRYASAFAYLMKGLGYETKVITGQVVARRGGTTPHGWTEVKVGGNWYIYDTELQDALGKDYYKKTYKNYPSKPLVKETEWEVDF